MTGDSAGSRRIGRLVGLGCTVLVLLAMGIPAVLVLTGVLARKRGWEEYWVQSCADNLRTNVYRELSDFAKDHDGRYPKDWAELIGCESMEDSIRAVPSPGGSHPLHYLCCYSHRLATESRFPPAHDLVLVESDYALESGLHAAMPGRLILAYDRRDDGHFDGSRSVLTLDGKASIRQASREAGFRKELEEQRAAVRLWQEAGAKKDDIPEFFAMPRASE